jgi:hypothetical protein
VYLGLPVILSAGKEMVIAVPADVLKAICLGGEITDEYKQAVLDDIAHDEKAKESLV